MNKVPFIGQLKHRVEIIHVDPNVKSETGETVKLEKSAGNIHSQRLDHGGLEKEDEKIFYLQNRVYKIRFVDDIWKNGQEMFVRDEDGDYQIYSVELLSNKRFLVLKTTKIE